MEEEEENKRKREGRNHRSEPEGAAHFQRTFYDGATVSDDVIMAGIEELPICSMTRDDAIVKLRRRIFPRILRIYDWDLLDIRH